MVPSTIFNLPISTGQIPEIWHKVIIIPILKSGKDNSFGKNWHTISQPCRAAKTLEEHLLPKSHRAQHGAQHGLRSKHLTCTALLMITADIAAGFSRKKAGSPNSAHRARSDSYTQQFGPSSSARLCIQHQHTDNNPSLALQLYAEQTCKSSSSATII